MANGVEVRPPYLDHRIIEFMGTVPSKWKIRGLNEKYILKKTLQDLLPGAIVSRPKHPYRAPISATLGAGTTGPLQERVSDSSIRESGLFDVQKVRLLFKKLDRAHQVGEVERMALAGILSSQIVFDRFISRFPSASPARTAPVLLIDRRTGTDRNRKPACEAPAGTTR
jgi:asparagine synthase (glutamine-hydrolysing)